MDDHIFQLHHSRDLSITKLDKHLITQYQANRLDSAEIQTRRVSAKAGWVIFLEIEKQRYDIIILVSYFFPFEPPSFFLKNPSKFLQIPHIDKNGKICLTTASTTFSPSRMIEATDFLIEQTQTLLSGFNADDFVLEFQNYWRLLPNFSTKKYWSILHQLRVTRNVYYYSANGFTLFGESEEEMELWIKNFSGGVVPKGFSTKKTVIIWLQNPLLPEKYPEKAYDILTLSRNSILEEGDNLLGSVIPKDSGVLPILLGFETKAGNVLAGVEIVEPKKTIISSKKKKRAKKQNKRQNGFRPQNVPIDVELTRFFGGEKIFKHEVIQIDAASCFTRGGCIEKSDLHDKKVAIVGCGSLGAEIAVILAKSGIGKFILIDNDVLTWGNIVRHVLGGDSVGEHKVIALEKYLTKQLPWLSVSAEPLAVEELIYNRTKILIECDLILSTSGDWASDCCLNAATRTMDLFPPVLFGWTEAFGIAGHALIVHKNGGCLACGSDEFGVFNSRVTSWSNQTKTLVQATGCSDLYQPYNAVDIAPIKGIIAELALDYLRGSVCSSELRTWIGAAKHINDLGGQINPKWAEKIISGDSDRRTFIEKWSANPQCPLCE